MALPRDNELPGKIVLQWHITDRCNYRCSHCYQEGYGTREPGLSSLTAVLSGFRALLERVQERTGRRRVRGHVTVTGGEPFLHNEFSGLLRQLSDARSWTSFGILTNGSMIDRTLARGLKDLDVSFVQVSLEGSPATHDSIRGAGSHDRTVQALRHLAAAGVRTLISFTAHKKNFREFPEVVRLGRKLKVWRIWSDRVIPRGSGALLAGDCLSPEETQEFFSLMDRCRNGGVLDRFRSTEVSMDRALQFLAGGGRPYSCQAGSALITVMPDGTLYPCRRMPVACGNVHESALSDLYFENNLLRSLRGRTSPPHGCERCFYAELCRGGLRCLSYAVQGDPFRADPGCWRAAPVIAGNGKRAEVVA